ncbi:hypothetical protein [Actinophytocola sp.]|uniref:hypothetical protein n=1 Tax=Actinophytocola sp. TaxID=1872138 RepID=UPI00389A7378
MVEQVRPRPALAAGRHQAGVLQDLQVACGHLVVPAPGGDHQTGTGFSRPRLAEGGTGMPTAVEYALVANPRTQNGCGSGPPALNSLHTQSGGPSGQAQAVVAQPGVPPAGPSGELLLTGPLATLLLVVAVLAATRRARRSPTSVRDPGPVSP